MDATDTLATSPCDSQAVPHLLSTLTRHAGTVSQEGDRLKLLETARQLVSALETPRETVLRLCWAEPTRYACVCLAMDMRLFAVMKKEGRPCSVLDLVTFTKMEFHLVGRIMRHLAAMGVVQESGPSEYQLTNFSRTLVQPEYAGGFPCMARGAMNAIYQLPQYFAATGYTSPDEATHGPFQFAYETRQHWFAWARDHPPVLHHFNHHMAAYHQGRPSWQDPGFYPVEERLVVGADRDPEAVFLVDIGGGLGHDLVEFSRKHPSTPGRLILQDLGPVIRQIQDLPGRIDAMVHDFFTEQPIRGARAYYLHSVLHDWPDDRGQAILTHVAAAMDPHYSKLLIYENVVPAVGAGWEITSLDLMVMTLASARERTRNEWDQLLGRAGLQIVRIWTHPQGVESLIECVRQ